MMYQGKKKDKAKENNDLNSISSSKSIIPRSKSPALQLKQKTKSCQGKSHGNDKIKVYLRVRPPLEGEEIFDFSLGEKTITIPPQKTVNSSFFCDTKTFKFKGVLNSYSKQSQVYERVAEPMIEDFLKGNDVLIFCYGNTNAGKTYTVIGTEENPGILYRLLDKIIPELLALEREDVKLYATFNEIYNEKIIDLLSEDNKKDQLSVGISSNGDTEIKGCIEMQINSLEDAQRIIKLGLEGRHRGRTELNCDSSRSHTIFRLKYANKNGYSWLSVVDLAGAERVSIVNTAHGSFREACNINKSMLVLGKCIRSLREQSTPGSAKIPIPYRESKLTHVFKNLFEPTKRQAKAAMIINISPAIQQINDTLFALQFASKASECLIKQVINPNDPNSPGSPDYSPGLYLEQIIDPNSPQMIERRMRVEIQKEMEEFLLQRQMQYEHQINLLTKKRQDLLEINGLPKQANSEVDSLKDELNKLNGINEELNSELSKINEQLQKNKEQTSKKDEEREKLVNEIESLKEVLENLSSLHKKMEYKENISEKDNTNYLSELYVTPELFIY